MCRIDKLTTTKGGHQDVCVAAAVPVSDDRGDLLKPTVLETCRERRGKREARPAGNLDAATPGRQRLADD